MTLGSLSACKKAPLPPELAAIECPAGQEEYAQGKFGNAKVMFVCIDKKLASKPELLRCDTDSIPLVCRDEGSILLARDSEMQVYSGTIVAIDDIRRPEDEKTDPDRRIAHVIIGFSAKPFTPTVNQDESAYEFELSGIEALPPSGFTYTDHRLCDRLATPLNYGSCGLEMRSKSLYWRVTVSIARPRGEPISAEEYRDELTFWMEYVRLIVDEPQP
jgi:hypothetical protein